MVKNKDIFLTFRAFFEVEACQQVSDSTWCRVKKQFIATKIPAEQAEDWFTVQGKFYRLSKRMPPNKRVSAFNAYKQALVSNDTVMGESLAEYIEKRWLILVFDKQIRNCFNRNRSSFRLNSLYAIKEIAEEIFLIVGASPMKKTEIQIHVN
jgi:hypothetical protein